MRLLNRIIIPTALISLIYFSCQPTRNKDDVSNDNQTIDAVDIERSIESDSLIVSNAEITDDPFALGDKPLEDLMTKVMTAPTIETKEYYGEGGIEAGKIGDIYRLQFGGDYFQIYKRTDETEFLTHAEITTTLFSTRQGLKVGMPKSEILRLLGRQENEKIPKYMVIGDLEYDTFCLEFNDNKVSKIIFSGYLD